MMKTVKAILATFLSLLFVMTAFSMFATAAPAVDGSVSYDFSSCVKESDKESITKEDLLNIEDFGNVLIGEGELTGTVVTPGGYQGEGYIVVKLDAPQGGKLDTVLLDLDYWAYHKDTSVGAGYLKVLVSTNGTDFTELTKINATTEKNAVQKLTMGISAAKGQDSIYVKVVMQHWESFEGGAVKGISLKNAASDVYFGKDFATLTKNENKDEVDSAYLGVQESENVYVGGNYGSVVTSGGYQGEGYIVAKLEAAEGKTFSDVLLNMDYWAYHAGANAGAGYVKVQVSANGTDYTDLVKIDALAALDSVQNLTQYLSLAENQTAVYIKVIMQHWESYEGAALKAISLAGFYAEEQDPPIEGDDDDKEEPSVPASKTKVALSKDFSFLPVGEVTTREIGAEASANMKFGVDGVPLLSARSGYEDAFATWKLEAAEGETFDDLMLTFVGRTWYQDAAQKDNNFMKVSVSTDNTNFALVKEYKSNDNADMDQEFSLDLSAYAKGASVVYVRFDFLVFDSPHCMGLKSLSLVGNANGGSGGSQNPVTGYAFPALAVTVGCVSAAAVVMVRKRK